MDLGKTGTHGPKFEANKAEQHLRRTDSAKTHLTVSPLSFTSSATNLFLDSGLDLNALCFEVDYALMVWTNRSANVYTHITTRQHFGAN